METYSLDIQFLDDRKSDLPHAPIAAVHVKTFTRRTKDGPPLITPDCVSIQEFQNQIDRLKSELDAILKTAKKKFSADDQRQSARAKATL